jgi:hypothetical protein
MERKEREEEEARKKRKGRESALVGWKNKVPGSNTTALIGHIPLSTRNPVTLDETRG